MFSRAAAFAVFGAFTPLLTHVTTLVARVPFLDGVTFGFLLAVYLWLCRDVRAIGRLASLVAISGGAFVLSVVAAIPFQLVDSILPIARAHHWGPGPMAFFLSGTLGAGIVSTAFLLLVPDRSLSRPTLGHIAMSAGVGGVLGILGFLAMSSLNLSHEFLPLLVVWQAGMAFALTMFAEWPVEAAATAPLPVATHTTPLPSSSSFIILVLVALTALAFAWHTVRQVQGKRFMARWEAQNAEFVAAAPSRDNLPPLKEQPLEEMFVARINNLSVNGSGYMKREFSEHAMPGRALPPARLMYHASYQDPSEGWPVSITIWQYPTAAWARYEARHVSGCSERLVGSQRVLFSVGESWWYSGTRVIRLLAHQPDVDAFFKVYLEKYPSDIEPSLPLFSLLRRQ